MRDFAERRGEWTARRVFGFMEGAVNLAADAALGLNHASRDSMRARLFGARTAKRSSPRLSHELRAGVYSSFNCGNAECAAFRRHCSTLSICDCARAAN
jgi:hypothetical protein